MTYSYTQINQYLTCPRRYRYRYLDAWQEKEDRAGMLFGRAFERALAAYFLRQDAAAVLFREWGDEILGWERDAGAEILKRFSGSDLFDGSVTMATGSSKIEPGAVPAAPVTLKWSTFSEAAEQAGISRRYGGIHFEAGDLVGRMIGQVVATQAWEKAQTHIQGTAK